MQPVDWVAQDWVEVLQTWRGLFPKAADPAPSPSPTFRTKSLDSAAAGRLFERWVIEAFRLSPSNAGYRSEHAYLNPPGGRTVEEIDGLVFHQPSWQGFLIECKNLGQACDYTPLAVFHHKVERRPMGTLGLFFSPSGYTDAAIEHVQMLHPIRILLFDRDDLDWAMDEGRDLLMMLRRKWEFAVQYGSPYFPSRHPSPGVER